MNNEDIFLKLSENLKESVVLKDEPMSKHTSFRIGGSADVFVKIKVLKDLECVLDLAKENDINVTIIGNGSNILVKDNGIRGITAQINFEDFALNGEYLNVGSGVKLSMLAFNMQKNGLSGIEFACGIPGTVGGAIRMNAGAYGGEFKDIVEDVTYITRDGQINTLKNDSLGFSYRHSRFSECDDIILSCRLKLKNDSPEEIKKRMDEYLSSRKEKQPFDLPNAGSIFKRGEDFIASKLIDEAGLKGYTIGGAQISKKHAGFIVNTGKATASDVLKLIDYVKEVVFEKFGKRLETEIEIIGE